MGRRGLRDRAARGAAGAPEHPLLHLPLVPRHGGGVLRGPRLPPLRDRGPVARAALREDALRQRAARRALPRGLPGDRARGLRRRRARDARLGRARDDVARGRLLLGDRRGQRGRGGGVLRVDGGRDRRGARRGTGAARVRLLRRRAGGERRPLAAAPGGRGGGRRRGRGGGAGAGDRRGPPGAARGARPPRAAPDRPEDTGRLERAHDLGLRARRARAGRAAPSRRARKAAALLLERASADGRLRHELSDGQAKGEACLDDYAFLIAALLDLFEADPDPRWLRHALPLQARLDADFADAAAGGYFFTAAQGEALLVRPKPDDDGALPAGNSVEALNLLRLAEYTGDERWRGRAAGVFRAFGQVLARAPSALPAMLGALEIGRAHV